MKTYDVSLKLRKHGESEIIDMDDIFILSDDDCIEESIQMAYGCWYDIMFAEWMIMKDAKVSKTYLVEQGKQLIRWQNN